MKSSEIGDAFASLVDTENNLRGQLHVDGHTVPLDQKNPDVREVEFGIEHRIYHFEGRSGFGGRILVTDSAATGYVVPSEKRRFPEQPGTETNPNDERVTFDTYSDKKAFKILKDSLDNPVERARNSATGGRKDD